MAAGLGACCQARPVCLVAVRGHHRAPLRGDGADYGGNRRLDNPLVRYWCAFLGQAAPVVLDSGTVIQAVRRQRIRRPTALLAGQCRHRLAGLQPASLPAPRPARPRSQNSRALGCVNLRHYGIGLSVCRHGNDGFIPGPWHQPDTGEPDHSPAGGAAALGLAVLHRPGYWPAGQGTTGSGACWPAGVPLGAHLQPLADPLAQFALGARAGPDPVDVSALVCPGRAEDTGFPGLLHCR